ncbi:DUF2141 domain-containing protein [Robiginitalea sp. IMCC44478]|uniref:DUF2141 domain-containing protein n=1 Tax=Robiginitalea sp. IMCC44478 TaxID=3459122 RepID=UPI0040419C4A
MKFTFLLLILMTPLGIFGQNTLEVRVEGVQTSEGLIQVALYNQKEGFLKIEGVFRSDSTKAKKGITQLKFEDLPEGEYALAIFHDENGNEKLDTNWIGIPREPMGFSNSRMKAFGPPSFEDCKLQIPSVSSISVQIE